ncbi:unnamed protein product, partial [Closterium sp. NIES-54]
MDRFRRGALALCLLTCFVFSPVRSVIIDPSQLPVLQECQQVWGKTFEGWKAGSTCGPYGPTPHAENITCNEQGMINAIVLTYMGLKGHLPDTLGNLTSLTRLYVSTNGLLCMISVMLHQSSTLPSMRAPSQHTRSLGSNALMGPIPSTFGSLSNLQKLSLGQNMLAGSIPSTFVNLTNLSYLSLGFNVYMNGSFPEYIGSLEMLEDLNHITIPPPPLSSFPPLPLPPLPAPCPSNSLAPPTITRTCTVTLLGVAIMVVLFAHELSFVLTPEVHEEMAVDKTPRDEKLDVYLNISFPSLPCNVISLDALDMSGNHEVDIATNMYKIRLDRHGQLADSRWLKDPTGAWRQSKGKKRK